MPVNSDISGQVRDTIADTFGINAHELAAEVSQATVPEWSSLNHVMLLAALEEQFGARFAMQDMAKMTSLAAIVGVLERHRSGVRAD